MLTKAFGEHVRAGFSGIWIESYEHDEAVSEIAALCKEKSTNGKKWHLLVWDIDRGLREGKKFDGDGNPDPLAPLKALINQPEDDDTWILVLQNYHRFLESTEIMQAVANAVMVGKSIGRHVVVLACKVQIPMELEKHFVVIEHELPNREALGLIADGMDLEHSIECLDAAAGLTRYEAEGAFALSSIRGKSKSVSPDTVWDIKAGALKKAGTLELHRGGEKFADLGGLEGVKTFCTRALTQKARAAKARGVLLLGVPGAGKSAFAKALGNEVGRPTILMDFGSLMGSLVGESEAKTRQALQIVDRMAPCILFCDEIEKGLAGASGPSGDSGVSQRMFGTLLTWLNDHSSDVFFIGTCNDIKQLTSVSAGAFTRAERFDGIFFIDLPDMSQRNAIWGMYEQKYEIDRQQVTGELDDNEWTGAEIKSCCRLASLLDIGLDKAAEMVVPVARTAGQQIANLREWADGRALDANTGVIYRRQTNHSATTTRRRIG